ncbi:MAG: cytidine deaminase, partial [Candidatus Azotimanducaceae bacterium]
MTVPMPDLFDAAVAAQQQSYSPYSKYPVGAAV